MTVLRTCLKNETKADTARSWDPLLRDLRDLISAAGADVAVVGASRKATAPLGIADKAHPLELAKYNLERAGASASEMDIKQ